MKPEVKLEVCKRCPHSSKFMGRLTKCKKCGCVMELKVKIPTRKCPVGKW